jgi:hypothetical protein
MITRVDCFSQEGEWILDALDALNHCSSFLALLPSFTL